MRNNLLYNMVKRSKQLVKVAAYIQTASLQAKPKRNPPLRKRVLRNNQEHVQVTTISS